MERETSGSAARYYDYQTTEAVLRTGWQAVNLLAAK
jgi:hypothetical protein